MQPFSGAHSTTPRSRGFFRRDYLELLIGVPASARLKMKSESSRQGRTCWSNLCAERRGVLGGTEGSNPSRSANESAMSARFSGATRETLACAGLWTRDAGNPPATSQTPPRRSRSTSDSGSAEATIVASDEVYRSGQIAEATTPSPATRRRFSV
jgi:hypothetical protein